MLHACIRMDIRNMLQNLEMKEVDHIRSYVDERGDSRIEYMLSKELTRVLVSAYPHDSFLSVRKWMSNLPIDTPVRYD